MANPYTLATYHVIAGKEEAFIEAWNALAVTFSSLPNPPIWGTLIRSTTDRTLFHSFGPWDDREDIAAMRNSPEAKAAFRALQALCHEMTPGDYEMVRHVAVRGESSR